MRTAYTPSTPTRSYNWSAISSPSQASLVYDEIEAGAVSIFSAGMTAIRIRRDGRLRQSVELGRLGAAQLLDVGVDPETGVAELGGDVVHVGFRSRLSLPPVALDVWRGVAEDWFRGAGPWRRRRCCYLGS
jgi:hypothetical protein